VPTGAPEVAACGPAWCRMGVLGGNTLVRIDIQRTDGSDRRRIAGSEATPTLVDAMVLDRFVPLATDAGDDPSTVGVGLTLYDVTTGRTDLIAAPVANIGARNGVLWWSTGLGARLAWNSIDLRLLP
jgi:hypothetical protein